MIIQSIEDFENLYDINKIILDICTVNPIHQNTFRRDTLDQRLWHVLTMLVQGYERGEIMKALSINNSEYNTVYQRAKTRIRQHMHRRISSKLPVYGQYQNT